MPILGRSHDGERIGKPRPGNPVPTRLHMERRLVSKFFAHGRPAKRKTTTRKSRQQHLYPVSLSSVAIGPEIKHAQSFIWGLKLTDWLLGTIF